MYPVYMVFVYRTKTINLYSQRQNKTKYRTNQAEAYIDNWGGGNVMKN